MRKRKYRSFRKAAAFPLAFLICAGVAAVPAAAAPGTHVSMEALPGGYNIFTLHANSGGGSHGYRYGPSILYYPGTDKADVWFASPGAQDEWDWFTYRHTDSLSTAAGPADWTAEKIVLYPTPDSMDHYSVCDPGVVCFGGYYYIGYTSTIVATGGGINNNCYVARSKNPDGPFEKWNGSGWGGKPAPVFYFNESDKAWGAGELSFVALDGTLYCYYTWAGPGYTTTEVALADAADENWPATLVHQGAAFVRDNAAGEDSWDVVYIEDCEKFAAFATYNRFTASSGIAVFESDDGLQFQRAGVIRTGLYQNCHNMGISKRPDGHINLAEDGDKLFVGYAYSAGSADSWGRWATRFQPVRLFTYTGPLQDTDAGGSGTPSGDSYLDPTHPAVTPIGITPDRHTVHMTAWPWSVIANRFHVFSYDTYYSAEKRNAEGLRFSGYDKSLIACVFRLPWPFNVWMLVPRPFKTGETDMTITYTAGGKTFENMMKVSVHSPCFRANPKKPQITSFSNVPGQEKLTIYMNPADGVTRKPQVRGFVTFENGKWGEAYNDTRAGKSPSQPPKVPAEDYPVTYSVDTGEQHIRIDGQGVITAVAPGTAVVTASITDGTNTFRIAVAVTVEPNET